MKKFGECQYGVSFNQKWCKLLTSLCVCMHVLCTSSLPLVNPMHFISSTRLSEVPLASSGHFTSHRFSLNFFFLA
jgi:hypothetical protein